MIKVGDKVKLIDKFYEHEAFKRDSRHKRKQIASLNGRELEAKDINKYTNRVSTGEIDYSIPLELLEKVEPKPGDMFKVIGNRGVVHCFKPGDIVKFTGQSETQQFLGLCGLFEKSGIKKWVHLIDLEPFTQHRYTAEQIAEARQIVYEEMTSVPGLRAILLRRYPTAGSFNSDVDGIYKYRPHTIAAYVDYQPFTDLEFKVGKHAVAFCLSSDEWNDDIGNMVAVCKLTGRKLPDWISNT